MRCEPWMDREPVRHKTPLELAREDRLHWKLELERAEARVKECRDAFLEAVERIDRLAPT
jgi:hypothetical protein